MRSPWILATAPLLLSCALAQPPSPHPVLQIDYEGFTIWLDCSRHGAIQFRYATQRDTGSIPRSNHFHLDPGVPPECQPNSADTFRTAEPPRYDRGHLVPANHMDHSKLAIRQTFFMTNILPQTATLNRGAWLASEEIIECYRDLDDLVVIGGVIWGNDSSNDHFLHDHGIATPDAYWKIVIRSNGDTIAWLMPNDTTASRARLDAFLVTPARLENVIGQAIPAVKQRQRKRKPERSWRLPENCDFR